MVSSLFQCRSSEKGLQLLSSLGEDPHSLCMNCSGNECNSEDRCGDCYDWSNKMWNEVSVYRFKLAAHWERKAKVSSSSFSGLSQQCLLYLNYLCHLIMQLLHLLLLHQPVLLCIPCLR